MDIKEKINDIAETIKKDPKLLKQFKDQPVKVVEKLLDIDLPDDKLQPIVTGIKAKLADIDLGDMLGGLKKLF